VALHNGRERGLVVVSDEALQQLPVGEFSGLLRSG
jgi:hypothetical protein